MKIKENKHHDGCHVQKEYVFCAENDGEREVIKHLADMRPGVALGIVKGSTADELTVQIVDATAVMERLAGKVFVQQDRPRNLH